jgi:hypothetical protein
MSRPTLACMHSVAYMLVQSSLHQRCLVHRFQFIAFPYTSVLAISGSIFTSITQDTSNEVFIVIGSILIVVLSHDRLRHSDIALEPGRNTGAATDPYVFYAKTPSL